MVSLGNLCLGQQDSTSQIVFNSDDPELIINDYLNQAKEFKRIDQIDTAITLLLEAEKIAKPLESKELLAEVYYRIGRYKSSASLYNESIQYYNNALVIFGENDDTTGLAKGFNRLGVSYKHLGQYSNSVSSLTKSFHYYHYLKDTLGQGSTKINLGNVFKNIGESEKAISYYHRALEIFIPANDENSIANCYNNLGNVYKNQGNFDSSLYYMEKTLEIRKNTNNQEGLSYIFHNLANLYIEMEDYPTALSYADSSLEIKRRRNDEFGIASEYEIFARIYGKTGSWKKSIEFGEKGLELIKPFGDLESEKEFYKTLAESCGMGKEYKKSAKYYELYFNAVQQLEQLNNSGSLENELIEFEILSDSINREQLLLKKELQETINRNEELEAKVYKRNFYLIVAIFFLFFVLSALLLIGYRNRLIKSKKEKAKLEKTSVPKEEKEVLLKEVHHRVKNNFQIINSLIRIQSEFMNQSNFKEKLIEIENRIRSMSLIHEKLYKSDSISKLDFKEYVMELSGHIKNSYENDNPVEILINVRPVKYGIDTLIPLGLILNECLSNALKHSFEGLNQGTINIELEDNSSTTTLRIMDNGIGADLNIDELKEESLGMELIWDLTNQLDGEVRLNTEHGFHYEFIFPSLN